MGLQKDDGSMYDLYVLMLSMWDLYVWCLTWVLQMKN